MTWEIVPEAPRRRWYSWWFPFGIGVLLAALGVAFLVWPFTAATWAFAVLIGAGIVVTGLALLSRRRLPGAAAAGALLVVLGVLAILFSEFTVSVLITFIGMTLTGAGVLWLVIALGLSRGGFSVATLPAILVVAAGVFAIVWPAAALVIAAVVFGVFLLGIGGLSVWRGWRVRAATRSSNNR